MSDVRASGGKTKKRKLNPSDDENEQLDVDELIVRSHRRVLTTQLLTVNSNVRKLPQIQIHPRHLRANVLQEIMKTERDFVKNLKDVIEGYLYKCRQRSDMFTKGQVECIFSNIEQLYEFQCKFLTGLEASVICENIDDSEVGHCFLANEGSFVDLYSEYCIRHTQSATELQKLKQTHQYAHFFEGCRGLQHMAEIPLDGFLIQPVQKICKYPLLLQELLKYTPEDHPDRQNVKLALETMKRVTETVNERKKRRECLEKIARWQETIDHWEGEDLVEQSSQLIHYGDLSVRMSNKGSRTEDYTFFLFDHQLIYCRRDILKRTLYCYKGRLQLNQVEIMDVEPNDLTGMKKHGWLMLGPDSSVTFNILAKSFEEKTRWMEAFEAEKKLVLADNANGFTISLKDRMAAIQFARIPRVGKEKRLKTEDALKDLKPQVDQYKTHSRLWSRKSSPASGPTSRSIPFSFKMPLFGNIKK